ncbi:MAG: mucoidy inhibitor MuiA family protein, partial [Ktedonobacterales bacterium]
MEIDLDTTITGVTVYSDRAQVARRGEATIEAAGEHLLRIGGLPLSVQRDSFRVTGQGPAGTRILGVEQSQQFHARAPEEKLTALSDEIERQERAANALDERIKANTERRGWLTQLAEQSARSLSWSLARGLSKPEDISAFLAFVGEETQRAATATLDLKQERKDLIIAIEALRREYAQLDSGWLPDRLAASVRLTVTTPGVVVVSLSYLTGGAGWRPRYDARVNVDTSSVRLTQQALVTQSTTEAWSGVALTLSTARPSVARQLPDEPTPWYLNVYSPPIMPPAPPMPAPRYAVARAMVQSAVAAATPMATATEMHDATPMPQDLTLDEAVAERSGAAQIFHISGDVDIPSDGMPHTLPIGERDLPGRIEYVAIPVESEGAHLRATVSNTTGQALPAGELH